MGRTDRGRGDMGRVSDWCGSNELMQGEGLGLGSDEMDKEVFCHS
jgi:hypothetical protein